MGFFKNIGASYEYLYDLMEFKPFPSVDVGSYERNPGNVAEKDIIKEESGFCIKIRREKQKRARTLRFSYIDIIRTIEKETPGFKNEKISRIAFTNAYIYNVPGYRGKSIIMRVDFGDKIASSEWRNKDFSVYQYSHSYFFGHKFEYSYSSI